MIPTASRLRSACRRGHALTLLLALVATLLVGAAPAAAKPLEKGDRGARVVKLQQMLGLRADGVFGAGTHRAVKRFQRRHRITADGIVGAGTWSMLRRARAARRARSRARASSTASSGQGISRSRTRAVRILQRRLGIAVDGVFGPGTLRAVKAYQRRKGLTPDGVVGPGTWSALGVSGRPVLKRSRRGTRRSGVPVAVLRAIAAANRIARKPYRYGGGHRSFTDSAYDCSGSLSYVLHGAGRLSSPLDSSRLMSYGAPGRGRYITIYANPGHAFMVIRGRRYDTTGRWQTGSRWQPEMRSTAGYVARHPPGL
jgi:peptidoglycan hydrolase-like protein with peptidoglycan-binding domain